MKRFFLREDIQVECRYIPVTEFAAQSNRYIHHKGREECKAQLHKYLNSEGIIRPGTRITRIKRICTDMCMLTLRDNTGRPETIEVGSNMLAGTEAMIGCARSMLERGNRGKNTLGDGRAGERIVKLIGERG